MPLLEYLTLLAVGIIKFAAVLATVVIMFKLYNIANRINSSEESKELQDLKVKVEELKSQSYKQIGETNEKENS